MIRRLYNKGQEVIQQGSGVYTTRFRRLLAGFFWYRCYYLHQLRDALPPTCGIFLLLLPSIKRCLQLKIPHMGDTKSLADNDIVSKS